MAVRRAVRRATSVGLLVILLAWAPATSLAAQPSAPPASQPSDPPATQPSATVLAPAGLDSGAAPTPAGLARVLEPLLRDRDLGRRVGAAVADAATGAVLYARSGNTGLTPASTTKLLTAAAVLATAGPDARLSTRVLRVPDAVAGPPSSGPSPPARAAQIVLVGGGDPSLTGLARTSRLLAGYPREASLAQLASQTAAALRREGVTRVQLGYDDSLFLGPRAAAGWLPHYLLGPVGPVSALSVDQARVRRPGDARVRDAAAEASRRFAALLARSGITVSGRPHRRIAAPGAEPIAAAQSPPIAALVEHMLQASDNDVAEALGRKVALASGGQASFAGAAQAIVASLRVLGIDKTGVQLYDASGLSRRNRVPARALAQVLRVAAQAEHPELRTVLTGLPVAGFTGTLDDRFQQAPASAGAGLVKGKTGFLTGVVSLAGVLPDASGRLLAYAFIADALPPGRAAAARDTMDRMAAALVRCGCR
jgi:D-alanyl-D-alanine carboxypeptidase/D-alanyl-D-alanine-endopeptidase (penicillin-binding protein 4)